MNIYSHFSADGTKLEPFPFISELAMEGYLEENPEILKLSDDDEEPVIKEVEKDWKRGGKGRGRIDLLAYYGDSTYAIIELKKGELNTDAFNQLKEYFEDKTHLKTVADSFELKDELGQLRWMGILVGRSIEDGLKKDIEQHNAKKTTPLVAVILVNRYKSGREIYTTTEIPVMPKNDGKDHSLFEFRGRQYKKGRLVHAMVKAYVEENYGTINIPELKNRLNGLLDRIGGKDILPDYDWAVAEALRQKSKDGKGSWWYYYIKPEDAVVFKDGTKLAVLGVWDIKNMPRIEKIAKALGYSYTQVG